MRTNIFVIGMEVGVVESYGGGKRVKIRCQHSTVGLNIVLYRI